MSGGEMVDLFAGPGGFDQAARELDVHATGIEYDPAASAIRDAANALGEQQ